MAELNGLALHTTDDVVDNFSKSGEASRYRIHRLLGQGGTGSTYQAEDLKTRRWVALKVMSLKQLDSWDLLTRFEREAEALGKIDHPGVPDYIEHFQVATANDYRFYLVQEFAAGKSLDKWVADGWRATEAEVKRIAAEVLNTLVYLHQLDPPMIHRDIKPQNIIRQPDGRIYLVDFGAVQSVYRDALQQRGTFVGTMGYMPPEQLRGKAVLASDLYGLGATLVFLLTHRNPDELPMERMRIAFRGRVKLSEGFATWLEKLLEPMVKNRWQTAEMAIQGLQASAFGPIPNQANLTRSSSLPKSELALLKTPSILPLDAHTQTRANGSSLRQRNKVELAKRKRSQIINEFIFVIGVFIYMGLAIKLVTVAPLLGFIFLYVGAMFGEIIKAVLMASRLK